MAQPFSVAAVGDDTIAIRRDGPHDAFLIVARLRGAGAVNLMPSRLTPGEDDRHALPGHWRPVLHTEDLRFCPDPIPPDIDSAVGMTIRFHRPCAIVLRSVPEDVSGGSVR